jgi:Rab-GTPase-TBC domain
MLKTLDEGSEASTAQGSRPPARTTLRDRFKLLRMREEAGITSLDDPEKSEGGAIAGLIGRSTSLGVSVASPSSVADEKEGGLASSPVTSPHSSLPPSTVNSNLAPGTVSGISNAASDAVTPIDWDFWQTVVNDGPQAVARTSPEELAQSIATGIPQTIRGVIWQVLASSKNEDLEGVYQDLLVRGTDGESKDANNQISLPNGHVNGNVKEKDSIASSGSSVHSDHSTPATSTNIGVTSPTSSSEKDPDTLLKVQAKLAAERQKKVKDDATALQKLEKMIKRDMGARTSYSKYAVAAGFQDGLFNVCKAYALFDEGVGYPQGMNFIIMPLLFTMPEEEAFCLLVRLMNKYGLRELFIQDMPGLHLHLYQFERLLEDLEPALYCHLNRRGVSPKLYATQWFLTLFAYRFPLQLVMRVFDLVLSEGLEGAILKLGMAVVQRNVSTLLAMEDMAALTNFLKEKLFDVYIDQAPSNKSILESGFFGSSGGTDNEVYRADILVQDACAVKLTPEMLKRYRSEWTEKVRLDRERETELESYRTTVATQAAKIRSLEERAEKSDTEHVQIATDLVRLKVDNQELSDSNESLRGQVEELRKVVESEAATVEARLKGEMERVMQRNIEVQNENRLMEESMSEMEASLVETKMKYAEVSNIWAPVMFLLTHKQITENHETLKQKWNDLRKALD